LGNKDGEIVGKENEVAAKETEVVSRDTEVVSKEAEVLCSNTEVGAKDIEGVIRDTEGVNRDIEGVTRDTEGVTRDTEGVTRDAEGVTRDTENVAENMLANTEEKSSGLKSVSRDTEDTSVLRRDDVTQDSGLSEETKVFMMSSRGDKTDGKQFKTDYGDISSVDNHKELLLSTEERMSPVVDQESAASIQRNDGPCTGEQGAARLCEIQADEEVQSVKESSVDPPLEESSAMDQGNTSVPNTNSEVNVESTSVVKNDFSETPNVSSLAEALVRSDDVDPSTLGIEQPSHNNRPDLPQNDMPDTPCSVDTPDITCCNDTPAASASTTMGAEKSDGTTVMLDCKGPLENCTESLIGGVTLKAEDNSKQPQAYNDSAEISMLDSDNQDLAFEVNVPMDTN
jgi:hypothetical protein